MTRYASAATWDNSARTRALARGSRFTASGNAKLPPLKRSGSAATVVVMFSNRLRMRSRFSWGAKVTASLRIHVLLPCWKGCLLSTCFATCVCVLCARFFVLSYMLCRAVRRQVSFVIYIYMRSSRIAIFRSLRNGRLSLSCSRHCDLTSSVPMCVISLSLLRWPLATSGCAHTHRHQQKRPQLLRSHWHACDSGAKGQGHSHSESLAPDLYRKQSSNVTTPSCASESPGVPDAETTKILQRPARVVPVAPWSGKRDAPYGHVGLS